MSASVTYRADDPAFFEVKDAVCGNEHRFFLSGELDLVTGPLLEEMVSRVCAAQATNTITLDLSEVPSWTRRDCAPCFGRKSSAGKADTSSG